MSVHIGLIGFGEVGYVFSRAMREAGAEIMVYDVLLDDEKEAPRMERRIQESGNLFGSLKEVVESSDYVFSTVITQVVKDVASLCSRYLKAGQTYVDLNSTSPSVKVALESIVEPTGTFFVEGAILGAVGATGSKTRILTAGEKGQEVADTLNEYGLNVTYYSPEIGKASMFKMLRSIFSKGVEIILLEMLVAGKRAGIEKDLWKDITDFMASKPFDQIGANWICSHAVAHERRYFEVLQVLETMREIGIDPLVTDSTAAFFKRSMAQEMKGAFGGKPESLYDVVDYIEKKLGYGT